MIDTTKEYILCAAIRRKTPKSIKGKPYHDGTNDILNIEVGYRHHDIYMRFKDELSKSPYDQGFYTSKGRFVDRYEGMKIAIESGQVPKSKGLITKESEARMSEFDSIFSKDTIIDDSKDYKGNPEYYRSYYQLFSEDLY